MVRYPTWAWASTFLLALAGLGVSIYLSIEHASGSKSLACPDSGLFNCHLVTTSKYSVVAGIPVAYLGLAFFVGMTLLFSPPAWTARPKLARWVRLLAVTLGMGMVLYLVWAELYRIHAICLWCTTVHVVTLLLFAITVLAEAGGPLVAEP